MNPSTNLKELTTHLSKTFPNLYLTDKDISTELVYYLCNDFSDTIEHILPGET